MASVEGFEHFEVQFLSIAKGSAGELRSQLFIASDCGYISSKQFAELYALARQVSGKLGALITYLRGSGMRGSKFQARVS